MAQTVQTNFIADPPKHIYVGPTSSEDATSGAGGGPGLHACMLRRVFDLPEVPAGAAIDLFAEQRYKLYINGKLIGRGPTFHHPHRLPVTRYDIGAHLKAGRNVVAVLLGVAFEAFHNHVPTGKPGCSARLSALLPDGSTVSIDTDADWRATAQTGWRIAVPRRSWAIDHIEVYDSGAAPVDWIRADFDDSSWNSPTVTDSALPGDEAVFIESALPNLRFGFVPATQLLACLQTDSTPVEVTTDFKHGTYAEKLMAAPRAEPTDIKFKGKLNADGGGLRIGKLSDTAGALVELDLGAEHVGHFVLECECESGGVIDVGWSEFFRDGRPTPLQKGTSYVDQVHAPAGGGKVTWEPIQFNGGRYIVLLFRGFTGSVKITRCGINASEPALDWRADFECDHEKLNAIWQMCVRTFRVGTQESLMDCPTREQASYIGDGHPVARWTALVTGDAEHWKYLVKEQWMRPDEHGMVRSTPFSGAGHTLIDYPLLGVIWSLDYMRFTGDSSVITQTLEQLRGIVNWYDTRVDSRGLLNWHWTGAPASTSWEQCYDPQGPTLCALNLFVDHPGMGWHNKGDAGIDRRGFNAAINALRVRAMRALAEIELAVGDKTRAADLRDRADKLVDTVAATFFDHDKSVFVDGELDGKLLDSVSQHTVTWVLQALGEKVQPGDARRMMRHVLDPANSETIARGGPYFWTYIFPVLTELGMVAEALALAKRWWGRMLDGHATTLWETWEGDDLDTACHPWSGAAAEFLLTGVLGLPGDPGGDTYTLRPRYDLLRTAGGRICLPCGDFEIEWTTEADGSVTIGGRLPEGAMAVIEDVDGRKSDVVSGSWRLTLGAPAEAAISGEKK